MNRNITIISICLAVFLITSYIYWTNSEMAKVAQPTDEPNYLQTLDSDGTDSKIDIVESDNLTLN